MRTAGHLNESFLEEYVRNKIHTPDPSALFRHLAKCPSCRALFEELKEYAEFLRVDPEDTAGHIQQRHDTPEGTLFLIVSGADASAAWEARVLGAGHGLARVFPRGPQAKEWLERWFVRHFPDHICSTECGRGWI
jgi:anti-sigma factor RsiW